MHTFVIHVYGGGWASYQIFNAIATICSSAGYLAMINVMAALGIGCSHILASTTGRIHLPFKKLAGFMLIVNLAILPKANILVLDTISHDKYLVQSVPLSLSSVVGLSSSFGHVMTKIFESVMYLPGGLRYSDSGMIFGAQVARAVKDARIQDPAVNANMQSFAKQCVYYDTALNRRGYGRYSKAELEKTDNILKLLVEKSSKHSIRVSFVSNADRTLADGGSIAKGETKEIHCVDAARFLAEDIRASRPETLTSLADRLGIFVHQGGDANQNSYIYSKNIVRGRIKKALSSTFSDLSNIARDAEQTIHNAMAYNAIQDAGISTAENYAFTKSMLTKLTSNWITGRLAGYWVPMMHSCFSLLIWGAFPLIILLWFTPFCPRIFSLYIESIVWLQLWPPCFVILNFIGTSALMHGGASALGKGSALSAQGLAHLASNSNFLLASIASYLTFAVPFLARGFMKGMMGVVAGLSQSISGATASAVSGSVSEVVSGNASLGNVSLGNTSANIMNRDHLQANVSSSFGSMQTDVGLGDSTTLLGDGNMRINRQTSHLNVSASSNSGIALSHLESAGNEARYAHDASVSINRNFSHILDDAVSLVDNTSSNASVNGVKTFGNDTRTSSAMHEIYQLSRNITDNNHLEHKFSGSLLGEIAARIGNATESEKKSLFKIGGDFKIGTGSEFVSGKTLSEVNDYMQNHSIQDISETVKQYSDTASSHTEDAHLQGLNKDIASRINDNTNIDRQRSEHLSRSKEYAERAQAEWSKGFHVTKELTDTAMSDWNASRKGQSFASLSQAQQDQAVADYVQDESVRQFQAFKAKHNISDVGVQKAHDAGKASLNPDGAIAAEQVKHEKFGDRHAPQAKQIQSNIAKQGQAISKKVGGSSSSVKRKVSAGRDDLQQNKARMGKANRKAGVGESMIQHVEHVVADKLGIRREKKK